MPSVILTPDRPPPEDYYQNNCGSLFRFVLDRYANLLDREAADSLQSYMDLSDDAQRLFARLLTRKDIVRLDSVAYAEIGDLPKAFSALADTGLIEISPERPADQLLGLLRKDELAQWHTQAVKNLRKVDLIDLWLSSHSDRQIQQRLRAVVDWVCITRPDVWRLVQLLYFGDRRHDWSAFVIRDLGMVEYETVPMRSLRFPDRANLNLDVIYRRLSDLSYRLDDHPGLAAELISQLGKETQDRFVESRRAKSLLRIGQWHERRGDVQGAVTAYNNAARHPARERIVRVLHKHGDEDAARVWLDKIHSSPLSEEETQFAERFGKRQAGYQPPITTMTIDAQRADIEQQALELLLQPGEWGAHVENSLVRTFTGLMYWQAIFADIQGAFTNPFQTGPHDLYSDDFAFVRADLIDSIERNVADDDALEAHLYENFERKVGLASSLVNWRMFDEIPLADFLQAIPMADIRKLCALLIRNLSQRRAGLPDLLVVHGVQDYEFVEVKGPTDQLQPGQRVWFKHFARLGIPARVLKLKLVK